MTRCPTFELSGWRISPPSATSTDEHSGVPTRGDSSISCGNAMSR